jgi:dCMP deaminase
MPEQKFADFVWQDRYHANASAPCSYVADGVKKGDIFTTGPMGTVSVTAKQLPHMLRQIDVWTEALREKERELVGQTDPARPSWNEYFMRMAKIASLRSTCSRLRVGAVLVRDADREICGTGYNGAPSGERHCTAEDHEDGQPCKKALHAEWNTFRRWGMWPGTPSREVYVADKRKFTIYVTHSPCTFCAKAISSSALNIAAVVYGEVYQNTTGLDLLEESGIHTYQYKGL